MKNRPRTPIVGGVRRTAGSGSVPEALSPWNGTAAMAAPPWFRDGLRFECSRCGICCTGAPGYVWVTWEETKALARETGLSVAEFRRRYVRRVGNRYSLIERANHDCVFWSPEAGCTVYRARPSQCRTYPFWPENLENRAAWDEVAGECPGVGKGRVYSLEEIELIRDGGEEAAG